MNTTSKRLQSKYRPSATKIQQLYQQFSNIKNNCAPSTKLTKHSQQNIPNLPKKDFEPFLFVNEIQNWKQTKTKQTSVGNDGEKLVRQMMFKVLNEQICKLNRRLVSKIERMENQVDQISGVVERVGAKCLQKNVGKQKRRFSINSIIQIQQQTHHNKLTSGTQLTIDSDSLNKSQGKFQSQIHMLQSKLVCKEQEVLELQKQNEKLNRICDEYKNMVSQKQDLIRQLNKQIEEKSQKLQQIVNLKMHTIFKHPFNQSPCEDCFLFQQQIKQLKINLHQQAFQKQKITIPFDSFFDFQQQNSAKVHTNQKIKSLIQPNRQVLSAFDKIQLVHSQEQDDENLQFSRFPSKLLAIH